jgi:hypothetical protein
LVARLPPAGFMLGETAIGGRSVVCGSCSKNSEAGRGNEKGMFSIKKVCRGKKCRGVQRQTIINKGNCTQGKGRRQATNEGPGRPERDLVHRTSDSGLAGVATVTDGSGRRAVRSLRELACVSGVARCGKSLAPNTLHTLLWGSRANQRLAGTTRVSPTCSLHGSLTMSLRLLRRCITTCSQIRSPGTALLRCSQSM